MPRPLKRGILGASTIILSIDIDKYAFMCGSFFYETNVSFIDHNDFFDSAPSSYLWAYLVDNM